MKTLSDKTFLFSDSVIRKMSCFAKKFDAINLGQGYPEFDPPKEILDCLERISHDNVHQYSIPYGKKNVREAIARKQKVYANLDIDPETEITVTCGGTEAMMAVMLSIANKGDKIGMFTPIYENYKTACILTESQPVYVNLNPPEYKFNPEELENAFKQGLKAMIVCNPSNPSGRVFTLEEMVMIADLAKKYDTYIITDEVYEHFVYKPNKMIYMSALQDMKDRTIVCNSMSKTYSVTGWRIGYTMAPKRITDVIKKVHNFLTIAAPAPLQEAITVGLNFQQNYYDELLNKYTGKRDLICKGLDEIGIEYNKPEGTYFMLLDLKELTKRANLNNDFEFAQMMCEKYGLVFVPISSFCGDSFNSIFRLHFAKNDNTLHEALNRISILKDELIKL